MFASVLGITLEIFSTINMVIEGVLYAAFAVIEGLIMGTIAFLESLPVIIEQIHHACVVSAPVLEQILTTVFHILGVVFEQVINGSTLLFQYSLEGSKVAWNFTSSASSFVYDRLGNISFSEEASSIPSGNYLFEQLYSILSYIVQIAVILVAICIGIWIIKFIVIVGLKSLHGRRGQSSPSVSQRGHRQVARPPSSRSTLRLFESNGSGNLVRSSREGSRSELRRRQTNSPKPSAPPQDVSLNSSGATAMPQPSAPPLKLTAQQRELDTTSVEGTDSDTQVLQRELHQANEQLSIERDKSLCVICLDKTRELLLKPCNHYCLCATCSKGLRDCPVCKKKIQRTEKIFHA